MKKLMLLSVAAFSLFALLSCGSKPVQKTNYYDDKYVETLAAGLDARWYYSDSKSSDEDKPLDRLKKSINLENDKLKKVDFSEKKFKNSKLKELALAYDNELKNGIKVLDTATELSLYSSTSDWSKHYDTRTQLLSEINAIKTIPVKNQKILKELLNNGNNVTKINELDDKIKSTLSKIVFTEIPEEYASDYKKYEAVVMNEMDTNFKSFSANVYLEDASGTRIDTQYIYVNDWDAGQKVTFSFTTEKNFTTVKVVKNHFEINK